MCGTGASQFISLPGIAVDTMVRLLMKQASGNSLNDISRQEFIALGKVDSRATNTKPKIIFTLLVF